jgi:hypothetical protein
MAAFTTPADLADALTDRIRNSLLNRAFYAAKEAQEVIGGLKKKTHRRIANNPLLVIRTSDHSNNFNGTIWAVDINFRTIDQILAATVKNATDLLEDRVTRNIGESETLTEIRLGLGKENLIEGIVTGVNAKGEGFAIHVHMIWNYRYGENSANGVLTIYPQFRGTRQGAPMAGKAQQSTATAAKESAKAERLAAKAARRAEQRAKFAKAPERLARECDKSLKVWTGRSGRPDHPTAPEWAFIRDAARSLTADQLDEMFSNGLRTSGDIESRLEREYLTLKKASA